MIDPCILLIKQKALQCLRGTTKRCFDKLKSIWAVADENTPESLNEKIRKNLTAWNVSGCWSQLWVHDSWMILNPTTTFYISDQKFFRHLTKTSGLVCLGQNKKHCSMRIFIEIKKVWRENFIHFQIFWHLVLKIAYLSQCKACIINEIFLNCFQAEPNDSCNKNSN